MAASQAEEDATGARVANAVGTIWITPASGARLAGLTDASGTPLG
ncbi:hypothetical protein ACWCQW_18080 [Streptomyces mirabilis]